MTGDGAMNEPTPLLVRDALLMVLSSAVGRLGPLVASKGFAHLTSADWFGVLDATAVGLVMFVTAFLTPIVPHYGVGRQRRKKRRRR